MAVEGVRNTGGPFDFIVGAESDLATILNPKVAQIALARSEGTLWFHTGSAWQQTGHNALTIGADAEHSLSSQVLSGVDASASQKGHALLGVQVTGGGIETLKAIGSSGSSKTLALVLGTDGNVQTVTNSASCTYTMPSGLTSGVAISFTLIVTNNGAFTATFTGVKWAGAAAPTLTSGSGKIDIFSFITTDGGTTWYGFVQQNFA